MNRIKFVFAFCILHFAFFHASASAQVGSSWLPGASGSVGQENVTGLTTGDNYTNYGDAADDTLNELFDAIDTSWPVGSGSSIILDLADDASNEATDLKEIATSGDTNSVFTEPSADKLLINLSANWPTADTANAGDSATAFFSSGEIEDARLPAALTRDAEWDSIAEIETATGVDIITSAENNDSADDVTAADVGLASANLDDTDASVEWEDAADLNADGSITDGVIDEADLDIDNAPTDEYVLSYEATTGHFEWKVDATGAGGSAITFDIGDDGGNDSTDLNEIATSGDTNGVFTEPAADKMLIDLSANWPGADLASEATALAANGTDCSAGSFPLGVDASGNAESCTDAWTEAENTAAGYISGNETITLSGDATGSGTTAITVAVVDDSHAHVIGNIDQFAEADIEGRLSDVTDVYTNTDTEVTLDAEWDTVGEIETATGADIVEATETVTLTNKTIDADDNVLQDMPYDIAWSLVDPADADIHYLRLQRALTVSAIGCIVDPEGTGESVVLDIQECDSNGDNCATALSSTITCANTPTAGTVSDGAWDASDFIKIDIGTVTGTVKTLSIYGIGKESY